MGDEATGVPGIVRAKAAAAGVPDWAERLPGTLRELERAWSLTMTEPLPGGTSSYVTRATAHDGTPVVVKVAVPEPGLDREVRTLVAADGDGYVRVLAHDASRSAVLLESLGESLSAGGLTPVEQLRVLAGCLRRAWRVPRAEGQRPVDKAQQLHDLVVQHWDGLGDPCPREVVEVALEFARRRSAAFDPTRCVVVHGDSAAGNTGRVRDPRPGTEQGFVLLDPDGFVGDPDYDLGVAARDWGPELLAAPDPSRLLREFCDVVASEAGTDPVAVWEWAFVERVSTGLYVLSLGGDRESPHLRSAAAVLGGPLAGS